MKKPLHDMEEFLQSVHMLEEEIKQLIQKTDLTNEEKTYILNHILIIPGQNVS